jgi:hypothetical protein
MSNFLEIVNQILRRTGQETITTLVSAQSPVVQAMDFVNEAYFEILEAAECQFLQTKATFNTINGTALYTLAADADVMFLLKDRIRETTAGGYLPEMDPAMMASAYLADTGKPVRFWVEGTQLRLHPVPNAVYTIEYYYLKRPAKLAADADNSLIPYAWERLLVRGAQSLLERFLGEVESSRQTFVLYQDGLALLRAKGQVKPFHALKGFYMGYQP